jgi:hypothetical protein
MFDPVQEQAIKDGAALVNTSLDAITQAVDSIFANAEAAVPKLAGDLLAVAEDLIENLFPASARPFVAGILGSATVPVDAALGTVTPRLVAALKAGQANVDVIIGKAKIVIPSP